MRVLVVSGMYPTTETSWSGIFIHRQVVALLARGVEVEVICPAALHFTRLVRPGGEGASGSGPRARRLDGVPVTYVPYRHVPLRLSTRLEVFSLTRSLRRYVEASGARGHFDLVHGHGLFPVGLASLRLARELGVPVVVSARGSDVHRHPRRNRGIARHTRTTIRGADRVIAVSKALAQGVLELAKPAHPIEVIYNGVDVERFRAGAERSVLRSRLGLPRDGFVLCTVARLVREKGVLELLEAFGALRSGYDGVCLSVVGDGPLRETLLHRVRRQGLEGRVVFAGSVPHAQVADWLNAADVFVLPSYNEGLPNVVLEAMACRLPIVATRVGGIPEAAPDGVVGRLVPRREVKPLVQALSELVEKPAWRQHLGEAAYARVREQFSWEASAMGVVQVYGKALERTTAPHREESGSRHTSG